MQRMEELKEFLQEYRIERTLAKERNMENDCQCILPELENKIDLLIQEQSTLQESGEQETIKYLSFFRLMTSGYTQSYETAIAMGNKKLYLDAHMECVYWKPEGLFDNISQDMQKAAEILSQKFTQIEKYELFYIQKILFLDDWELLCRFLPQLVQGIAGRITSSSLLLEEEMEVLGGGYMEEPITVCYITKEGEVRNGK